MNGPLLKAFFFSDHDDRQRSHLEERERPPPPMQPMRPPPTHPRLHIGGGSGSSIKKEAEVDPIAATN